MDYSLVVGLDAKHNEQLKWTLPTWIQHKPSLLKVPLIAFYDRTEVSAADLRWLLDFPQVILQPWPLAEVNYPGDPNSKFSHPQRVKMLSGFVHVPALLVETDYWLKLDTDTVAVGMDDWIDEKWFVDNPAIVSHRWTFTKPPDQMIRLDNWCSHLGLLKNYEPLNLVPEEGSERLGHRRIISWCGFFNSRFSRFCSSLANHCQAPWKMPVESQDGYHWYVAKRMGREIIRTNMKGCGWEHWSTMRNVKKAAKEAMCK